MRTPRPQIRALLRTAGFTLVELIVVVVIWSVLAATALTNNYQDSNTPPLITIDSSGC